MKSVFPPLHGLFHWGSQPKTGVAVRNPKLSNEDSKPDDNERREQSIPVKSQRFVRQGTFDRSMTMPLRDKRDGEVSIKDQRQLQVDEDLSEVGSLRRYSITPYENSQTQNLDEDSLRLYSDTENPHQPSPSSTRIYRGSPEKPHNVLSSRDEVSLEKPYELTSKESLSKIDWNDPNRIITFEELDSLCTLDKEGPNIHGGLRTFDDLPDLVDRYLEMYATYGEKASLVFDLKIDDDHVATVLILNKTACVYSEDAPLEFISAVKKELCKVDQFAYEQFSTDDWKLPSPSFLAIKEKNPELYEIISRDGVGTTLNLDEFPVKWFHTTNISNTLYQRPVSFNKETVDYEYEYSPHQTRLLSSVLDVEIKKDSYFKLDAEMFVGHAHYWIRVLDQSGFDKLMTMHRQRLRILVTEGQRSGEWQTDDEGVSEVGSVRRNSISEFDPSFVESDFPVTDDDYVLDQKEVSHSAPNSVLLDSPTSEYDVSTDVGSEIDFRLSTSLSSTGVLQGRPVHSPVSSDSGVTLEESIELRPDENLEMNDWDDPTRPITVEELAGLSNLESDGPDIHGGLRTVDDMDDMIERYDKMFEKHGAQAKLVFDLKIDEENIATVLILNKTAYLLYEGEYNQTIEEAMEKLGKLIPSDEFKPLYITSDKSTGSTNMLYGYLGEFNSKTGVFDYVYTPHQTRLLSSIIHEQTLDPEDNTTAYLFMMEKLGNIGVLRMMDPVAFEKQALELREKLMKGVKVD